MSTYIHYDNCDCPGCEAALWEDRGGETVEIPDRQRAAIYVVSETGGEDSREQIHMAVDVPWPSPGDRIRHSGEWYRIVDRDIDYDAGEVTLILSK